MSGNDHGEIGDVTSTGLIIVGICKNCGCRFVAVYGPKCIRCGEEHGVEPTRSKSAEASQQ